MQVEGGVVRLVRSNSGRIKSDDSRKTMSEIFAEGSGEIAAADAALLHNGNSDYKSVDDQELKTSTNSKHEDQTMAMQAENDSQTRATNECASADSDINCQCQRLDQLKNLLRQYLFEERRIELELQHRQESLSASDASVGPDNELESLRSQLRRLATDYQSREDTLLAACDPVQVLDFYEFKLAALGGGGGGGGGAVSGTSTAATSRRQSTASRMTVTGSSAAAATAESRQPALDKLRRQIDSLNQAMSVFTEASQQFNSLMAMEARLYDGSEGQQQQQQSQGHDSIVSASVSRNSPAFTNEQRATSRAASVAGDNSTHHSPGCPAALTSTSQSSIYRRSQHQQQQLQHSTVTNTNYDVSHYQHQQQQHQHQHRVCEMTIAGLRAALADAEQAVGRRSAARTEEIRQLTFELRGVQARLTASQTDEARLREERRKLTEANERLSDELVELRRQLERFRSEAAESVETGRELRTAVADLQSDKAELLAGLEAICSEKNRLHERLSSLEAERSRLAEASAEANSELALLRRERVEFRQRLQLAESAASTAEATKTRCQELVEQLRMAERRAESLAESRDAAQEALEKARSYQTQRERDYQAALEAAASLEESLAAQQASVARLSSHTAELERQKLQLTDACVRWSEQHSQQCAALESAEARIVELLAEKDQLKVRLDDLTDAWDEVRGEVETGYGARARLQAELRESQAEASTWRASCLQLEEERRGLDQRREALESERTRLQTELDDLRGELEKRESEVTRIVWEKEQTEQNRADLQVEVDRLRLQIATGCHSNNCSAAAAVEQQHQQLEAVQRSFTELSEKWERTLEENSVLQGTAIELRTKLNSRAIRLDQCMAENARLRDLLRKAQQPGSRNLTALEFGGVSESISETILEEKNRHIQNLLAQIGRLTSVLKSTCSLGGSAPDLHQQQQWSLSAGSRGGSRPATPSPKSTTSEVSGATIVGWRGGQAEHLRTRVLQALVEALQAELSLKEDLGQFVSRLPDDWQSIMSRRVSELAELRHRLGDTLSDIEQASRRMRERGGELAAQLHRLERENASLRERLRNGAGSVTLAARRRSIGPAVLDAPELLLHAVCRLDDFELLRKESRENLREIRSARNRVDERTLHYKSLGVLERSQSVDYSLLKHLARELSSIQFYAEERERLLNKFWITELPPWAAQSRQARYYHQYLHQSGGLGSQADLEVERWKGRYAALKDMLEQRLSNEEAQALFSEKLSGAETLLSVARHNLERAGSPAESAYAVPF